MCVFRCCSSWLVVVDNCCLVCVMRCVFECVSSVLCIGIVYSLCVVSLVVIVKSGKSVKFSLDFMKCLRMVIELVVMVGVRWVFLISVVVFISCCVLQVRCVSVIGQVVSLCSVIDFILFSKGNCCFMMVYMGWCVIVWLMILVFIGGLKISLIFVLLVVIVLMILLVLVRFSISEIFGYFLQNCLMGLFIMFEMNFFFMMMLIDLCLSLWIFCSLVSMLDWCECCLW